MTPNVQFVSRSFPEPETFMWFDLGTIPRNDVELTMDERLCRLPFDRTAICGRDAEGWYFGLACLSGEKSVTVGGCGFDGKNWHVFRPFAWADTSEGIRLVPAYDGKELPPREQCLRSMAIVHLMLRGLESRAMNSYQPVISDTFINQKRQRKSKKPLISWRTVVVEPSKPPAGPSLGGTHASPRQHDRRGHWRIVRGKQVWVRQCVVGDASRGMVSKDYLVRKT